MQQLFMHGPYTQGIFRKSANHKRCQEIRNKLDNGEHISPDDIPVTAACSVLKVLIVNCTIVLQLLQQ